MHRIFTEEWNNSGFINLDKLPEMVGSVISQKKSMIEYIEELHDFIDFIIKQNDICDNKGCMIAGCTSDHK